MLDRKGLGDASPGDLVVARRTRGRARVERTLGASDRIENVLEGLLVETGARQEFEPYTPPEITLDGRADLRELTTFTIDPETAEDFDDALSIDDERAYVHIADVSYFIAAGEPLDRGAARRGFSTYVPGRVAPMLPHELADDLCSLRPHADRLVVTVELPHDGAERELLPLGHPERRAAVVRAGATDPRRRRGVRARRDAAPPRRARTRAAARAVRTRRASHPDARDRVRVRRPRRRRRRAAAGRARRSRARRGVHDPARTKRSRSCSRRATAPRSTACTNVRSRSRSCCCSASSRSWRSRRRRRPTSWRRRRRPRSQPLRRSGSRRTSRSPAAAETRSPR